MAGSQGLKDQPAWLADFLRDNWTVGLSILFCPATLRQAFGALFMIREAMLRFWDEPQTPAVAQVKLGYWLEELQKMSTGTGSHPAIMALQPHLKNHPSIAGQLFQLAEATLHGLQGNAAAPQLAGAAAPVVAASMLLGALSPEALAAAEQLGVTLTAVEQAERASAGASPHPHSGPQHTPWLAMVQDSTERSSFGVHGGALGALGSIVLQRSQAVLSGQPVLRPNARPWLLTIRAWREAGKAERRLRRCAQG